MGVDMAQFPQFKFEGMLLLCSKVIINFACKYILYIK